MHDTDAQHLTHLLKSNMEREKLFVVSVKHALGPGTDISCRKFPVNSTVLSSIKLYFDFCYLLCLSPFRLVWDKSTHSYKVSSFRPHKILCAIVTSAFFITEYSRWFRESYPTNPKSPNQIFKFLFRAFTLLYRLLFFKEIWSNQEQIKNLVNFIQQTDFQLVSKGYFSINELKFYY